MKVARNDLCPCGSGKKYKRCCLDRQPAPVRPGPDGDDTRKRTLAPLVAIRDLAGRLLGRPFIDTEHQGHRVRAVGNQIVFRPLNETSHEFFIGVLCTELGTGWHKAQLRLPEAERHVIEGWVARWNATRRGDVEPIDYRQEGPNRYSATATGDLKALLCLAYDVYTLRHVGALPASLVRRLKISDQFQGARYELAVAAVFVRAGYELEWITDQRRKLPEFIARHPSTGTEIAVEAKSRHRAGVLGRPGERPDATSLEVDVEHLVSKALEKQTDERPYVICLDMNLPDVDEQIFEEWLTGLEERIRTDLGPEESEPFAAMFFTNYSWQWDDNRAARHARHFVVRPFSTEAIPSEQLDVLAEALYQYGDVP